MVLYLKLDQNLYGLDDFTDENALALTGTIYSDRDLNTVFNLTGYTLSFRFISQGIVLYDDENDISIVTAASGTWRYKPQAGRFSDWGDGEVVIRCEKSGTRVSAVGINGSANLHIMLV